MYFCLWVTVTSEREGHMVYVVYDNAEVHGHLRMVSVVIDVLIVSVAEPHVVVADTVVVFANLLGAELIGMSVGVGYGCLLVAEIDGLIFSHILGGGHISPECPVALEVGLDTCRAIAVHCLRHVFSAVQQPCCEI